jgi:hypothetical protein
MLKDLTLALIGKPRDNRGILTRLACERYAARFGARYTTAATIDEALAACKTRWLLVQAVGNLILSTSFFRRLDRLTLGTDAVIYYGTTVVEDDFATIDGSSVLFNLAAWEAAGRPRYNGSSCSAPTIKATPESVGISCPPEIFPNESSRAYISDYCAAHGGNIVRAQLELTGSIKNLPSDIATEQFYLDDALPYSHHRTYTKLSYLLRTKLVNRIRLYEPYVKPRLSAFDALIVPAEGLNPLWFCHDTLAKRVVVYSNNEHELTLMRRAFALRSAQTYGNLLSALVLQEGTVQLDELEANLYRNFVAQPVGRELTVEYVQLDPTGYELEFLLERLRPEQTTLVDFGQTFADPFTYVGRDRADVIAYFKYFCGRLRGNPSATFIHGYSPTDGQLNCQLLG